MAVPEIRTEGYKVGKIENVQRCNAETCVRETPKEALSDDCSTCFYYETCCENVTTSDNLTASAAKTWIDNNPHE